MDRQVVPMFLSGTPICLYLVHIRSRYLYNFNVIDYEKDILYSRLDSTYVVK